jgi:DNA-binding NarL/FixJ family response regulator
MTTRDTSGGGHGPASTAVRAVHADDTEQLRASVARLLEPAGITVVAGCSNGAELLLLVERHAPDVAIVDLRMPPTFTDEGLRAAATIRARWPAVGLVLLTQYADVGVARLLAALGPYGCGYLLKEGIADTAAFVQDLRRVATGGSVFDPAVLPQSGPPD